ncbi:hypothetical protein CMO96_01835 [Candidatus Woesebacteria bacterium]|nr:hypothetical protein [Candidatus Woesebacteria bacterium]
MSRRVQLSASRIKTAQQCSWTYWCKYILKLPDTTNEGASKGWICHLVFETLGQSGKKREFNKILKERSVWGVPSIKKLIMSHAKRLAVDDDENLEDMDKMIVNGLGYNFHGDAKHKPNKKFIEKEFNIDVDERGVKYSIRGFIDQLFLYKDGTATIRDFKSSKQTFKGKDLTDNLQDIMYSLAVRHLFPGNKSNSEFVFLKFDLSTDLLGHTGNGVIKMPTVTSEELDGFEHELSAIQTYLENYSYKNATCSYAAKKDYPKDGSFGGPLACGREGYKKRKGEFLLDANGKKIKNFICAFRKPMKYSALLDKDDNVIKTSFYKDRGTLTADKSKGEKIKTMEYDGCPHFHNKGIIDDFLS